MFQLEGTALSKTTDYKGHTDSVDSLLWHPQNESVFVSTSADKTIRLWDSKQSSKSGGIRVEKTKEENLHMAFSPDGNILGVSNVKEELNFYDFRMWKLMKQIKFKNEVNEFVWDN
jgi:WD40 repeat protein